MHLFHIPQCSIQNKNVHISVLSGGMWDMEQVHSGIYELGQIVKLHCLLSLRANRFKVDKIVITDLKYRQVSNIRRTKSQNLNDSRTVLRLSLPNPLKPDVKSRMKM